MKALRIRNETAVPIYGGVLLILACTLLFFFNPSNYSFYPICLFHKFTGLDCPACGSLRAIHHLLHGEIMLAFRCNALLVLSVPLLAAWGLWRFCRRKTALAGLFLPNNRLMGWSLLVIVIFGVLRNLPVPMLAGS